MESLPKIALDFLKRELSDESILTLYKDVHSEFDIEISADILQAIRDKKDCRSVESLIALPMFSQLAGLMGAFVVTQRGQKGKSSADFPLDDVIEELTLYSAVVIDSLNRENMCDKSILDESAKEIENETLLGLADFYKFICVNLYNEMAILLTIFTSLSTFLYGKEDAKKFVEMAEHYKDNAYNSVVTAFAIKTINEKNQEKGKDAA